MSARSKYQAEKYTWMPFDEWQNRTVATLEDYRVTGFKSFQDRYFSEYHSLPASHQLEWATIYDDGKERYVLINEPRESGKSITWSTETPVYEFLKDYNSAGLLVTASDALSKTYTRAIVDTMLMNKGLVEDFHTNWWFDMKKGREGFSAHEIFLKRTIVRREPAFRTAGVGAAIIGFHPDYIILDDVIQSEEDRSAVRGEKLRDWVRRVLLPMQAKRVFVIGTRKGPNDIYQFFREMGIFKVSSRKALSRIPQYEAQLDDDGKKFIILKEDLTQYQKDKLVYWSEKYTLEDLLMIREMIGAEAFSGEFQNDPIPATGQTFLGEWLEYYDYYQFISSPLFREASLYTVFDPGGASEAADYNALVTIALAKNKIYLLDVKYGHWRPEEAIKKIAQTYYQWNEYYNKNPLVIGVEAEFLQGIFISLGRALGYNYIPWMSLYPGRTSGAKADRIDSLSPYFSQHQVYVSEHAQGIEEFKKEYLLYDPEKVRRTTRDKHRPRWDVLDAFQQAVHMAVGSRPAILGVKYY